MLKGFTELVRANVLYWAEGIQYALRVCLSVLVKVPIFVVSPLLQNGLAIDNGNAKIVSTKNGHAQ
jgi:hypothetical protein